MGYKIPDLKEDIQAAVFDYMDKYDCPQTFTDQLRQTIAEDIAYDILDKLHDFGFRAPLQVYRALDKLIELGLVHRLETLNAFVACQHKNCESNYKKTTMFTICEMCGNVHEFVNTGLIKLVKFLENDGKFKTSRTVVEFKGVCSACTE